MKKRYLTMSAAVAALAVISGQASAQLVEGSNLLTDDFNSDTSANYTELAGGNTEVIYAFDYSALTDHDSNAIGTAPNSGDSSTSALYMEINDEADGAPAVSNLTVFNNTSFSGNYRVKVDVYQRVNGPSPAGGAGSTQHMKIGINTSGTILNNFRSPIGGEVVGVAELVGDGYAYYQSGDNGFGSTDLAFIEGATPLVLVNGQDGMPGLTWSQSADPSIVGDPRIGLGTGALPDLWASTVYPVADFAYSSPGDNWVSYQFDYVNDNVIISTTTSAGTFEILQYDSGPTPAWTSGLVMLGIEDYFDSQSPAGTGFTLFDNLEVVELLPATAKEWTVYE